VIGKIAFRTLMNIEGGKHFQGRRAGAAHDKHFMFPSVIEFDLSVGRMTPAGSGAI
jgi:hypothetical protein